MNKHHVRPMVAKLALMVLSVLLLESISSALLAATATLAERTPVKVMLCEQLISGQAKKGQEVAFEVREDLFGANHELLVTKGTPAYGTVIKSNKRGMFGKPGKLDFTCEYTKAVDGTRVPLRSTELGGKGRNNTGAMVATALFVSVLGVFVHGRDVNVKKGTEFTVFVDKDTLVDLSNAGVPGAGVSASAGSSGSGLVGSKCVFALKNGSLVVGTVKSLENGSYAVATDDKVVQIAIDSIKSIDTASSPASGADKITTFELKDGQTVKGKIVERKNGNITVKTSLGTVTIPESDVVKQI